MGPFLPGNHHAKPSRSKKDGPTEVRRPKSESGYKPVKERTVPAISKVLDPRSSYHNDYSSQADTEYTRTDVEEYLVDSRWKEETMAPNHRSNVPSDRNPRASENLRSPRPDPEGPRQNRPNDRNEPAEYGEFDHHHMEELNTQFHGTSLRDPLPFPVEAQSLYEQILILRHQGARITYTPSSRNTYVHDPRVKQHPPPIRGFGSSFDLENPTPADINAIDHAIAHVINTGGSVQFPAIDRHSADVLLTCDTCSRTFHAVKDRDEHIGGRRVRCPNCTAHFDCRTQAEEHVSQVHKHSRGTGYGSSLPGSYDSGYERSEQQSRSKGAGH